MFSHSPGYPVWHDLKCAVQYKRSTQKTSDYSNILENLCAVQMYRNNNNMYYVDTNDHGTTGHLFHAHA